MVWQVFEADGVLNGTGRVPNVSNLGLDVAGVAFDTMRGVSVNEFYQTANPNVYSSCRNSMFAVLLAVQFCACG